MDINRNIESSTIKNDDHWMEDSDERVFREQVLKRCFSILNAKEKKVIYMLFFDGMTLTAAAKELGVSTTSIATRRKKALRKMWFSGRKYFET